MDWQHGHFHWNELMTRDQEAAKAFYAETLGWSYQTMPMPQGGDYLIGMAGDRPAGGIMAIQEDMGLESEADTWFPYIAVDDIDRRLERVEAAGGKIVRPAFDVPGVGRIAIVRDKAGCAVGWITPAEQG